MILDWNGRNDKDHWKLCTALSFPSALAIGHVAGPGM